MRLLLIVAFCLLGALAEKKLYDNHRLLRVSPQTLDEVAFLHGLQLDDTFVELDFWTEPSRIRPTDVRVSPNDYEKFRAALIEAGIEFQVVNEDLQRDIYLEAEGMRRANMKNTGNCDLFNEYCDLGQTIQVADFFAVQYPNNVDMSVIGYSIENRPIYQIKVAEDLNNAKPAIFLECATHAREWVTVNSCLYMLYKFLEEPTPQTNYMLSLYDWYVIPVHNPDGYDYSHVSDRYWRKNRRACTGGNIGVDLNRNWDAGFGGLGTSNRCRDDIYTGTHAFSEPETAALRDAMLANGDVFAFFAIHSYGEMLLVPYAYTYDKPPNYDHLEYVAIQMANSIAQNVDGTQFLVGTSPDILYPAAGGSDDFWLLENRANYSYTYELRPVSQAAGGFNLPLDMISYAIEDVYVSLEAFVYTVNQ